MADLVLRSRPVHRPDDLMTLTAQSDESLVIDNAQEVGGAFSRASTVLAITVLLQGTFPAIALNVTTAAGPAIAQGPYSDRWDVLLDFADRIDARLYDDGLRNWWLTPAPVLGTPAHTLAVGSSGTVLTSDSGLDRDEWANKVILRYQWRDTGDVDHTIVSTRRITSGIYAAVVGNTKSLLVERSAATTQAEADTAATNLVKRTVTRGRSFNVTAISAYWLRPGHTVTMALPVSDPEDHLVQAVTFDLAEGTMDVTTRLPDNTGTIGA
jgi:hypothetical protein